MELMGLGSTEERTETEKKEKKHVGSKGRR